MISDINSVESAGSEVNKSSGIRVPRSANVKNASDPSVLLCPSIVLYLCIPYRMPTSAETASASVRMSTGMQKKRGLPIVKVKRMPIPEGKADMPVGLSSVRFEHASPGIEHV